MYICYAIEMTHVRYIQPIKDKRETGDTTRTLGLNFIDSRFIKENCSVNVLGNLEYEEGRFGKNWALLFHEQKKVIAERISFLGHTIPIIYIEGDRKEVIKSLFDILSEYTLKQDISFDKYLISQKYGTDFDCSKIKNTIANLTYQEGFSGCYSFLFFYDINFFESVCQYYSLKEISSKQLDLFDLIEVKRKTSRLQIINSIVKNNVKEFLSLLDTTNNLNFKEEKFYNFNLLTLALFHHNEEFLKILLKKENINVYDIDSRSKPILRWTPSFLYQWINLTLGKVDYEDDQCSLINKLVKDTSSESRPKDIKELIHCLVKLFYNIGPEYEESKLRENLKRTDSLKIRNLFRIALYDLINKDIPIEIFFEGIIRGHSLLELSILSKDEELFNLLFKNKPTALFVGKNGRTPVILRSVLNNRTIDIDSLSWLLDRGVDFNSNLSNSKYNFKEYISKKKISNKKDLSKFFNKEYFLKVCGN